MFTNSRDTHGCSEKYEEIPKEFFCPLSKKFMSDPVTVPSSDLTYNRDSVKNLYHPEDVQPDLILRKKMEEWLSHYDLEPVFNSEEENFEASFHSVMKELKVGLLYEYTNILKNTLWLPSKGGAIWIVTMIILSYPNPPSAWITAALSLISDAKSEELRVPTVITQFHVYSLLDPISRACEFEAENEKFQKGLVNIMHSLIFVNTDISPLLIEKLQGGITKALVSYMWPVREHFIPNQLYLKLLLTLNRLSQEEACCQFLTDAGIIEMVFCLLEFAASYIPGISDNPGTASASMLEEVGQSVVIEMSLNILDRLCLSSEKARTRIGKMVDSEFMTLTRFIYIFSEDTRDGDTFNPVLRVLGHYRGDLRLTLP